MTTTTSTSGHCSACQALKKVHPGMWCNRHARQHDSIPAALIKRAEREGHVLTGQTVGERALEAERLLGAKSVTLR